METTMKLAIETYANLTNRTFDSVVSQCAIGNEVVIENIQKLMFCVE
jgi:hypothetical protein